MTALGVVILAAGRGTRMKSDRPKVLHEVCGRAMLSHVLAAAGSLNPARIAVVVGHGGDRVESAMRAAHPGLSLAFPLQARQLGTGHAARCARDAMIARGGTDVPDAVLVLCGDTPLLRPETLAGLVDRHRSGEQAITMLTATVSDPTGYGRVVRKEDDDEAVDRDAVHAVVEAADADRATRAIDEVATGVYVFRADWLWSALDRLTPSPSGELYLTDLVGLASSDTAAGVIARPADDATEAVGVNDRAALARAEGILRDRERRRHLARGVTMIDPATTWIDVGVEIGRDTVLWPGTYLLGATRIGEGCTVGPQSVIRNGRLDDGAAVELSVVETAHVGPGAHVGPFSRLREGTRLEADAHVGSYAEIKNSRLGRSSRMGHFGYLGDATVGSGVNIGAGTVTCNFDGRHKHETTVGDGAFIGSDTMLVAPVRIGADARTGAGAVVTRDVPDGQTVVGVPARALDGAGSSGSDADRAAGRRVFDGEDRPAPDEGKPEGRSAGIDDRADDGSRDENGRADADALGDDR